LVTVWVVESSKTIQRTVEIALADLPIKLAIASQVSELIAQDHEAPALLICAQRLGDHAQGEYDAYQVQGQQVIEAGHQCPLILLLDQKSSVVTESPVLKLVGSVRKPFKTQALVEVVAQSLNLKVPHAALFDESQRVIPLARSSNSSVSTQALKAQSSIDQAATNRRSTKVQTPSPSSVGSLLDAVTPVQERPKSSLSSSDLVTRKPQDSPAYAHDAVSVTPSTEDRSLHDLSPFPTTTKDKSSPPLITPSVPDSIQRPQFNFLPPPPHPSSGDSPRVAEAHPSAHAVIDATPNHTDSSPSLSESTSSVPTSNANHSTADQISLRGDWLDQHQHSPLPSTQDDELETAIDLAPLSSRDLSTPSAVKATTADVNTMAFDTVRVTTEKALALAERVSRHNAERLTPKEMKILIERIVWEVSPHIKC
jgi:hypothetical protein